MTTLKAVKLPVELEMRVADALVIEPGDTLILRVAGHLSDQQAQRLSERMKARLPGLTDVVVVGGVDQMAAFRPSQTEG